MTFGTPDPVAIGFFAVFIAITLGITYWAARRTQTADHFYAAGRSVTAGQNGFALAGDYMSAASFLGIAGLVSTSGFDGLIYSTGWLVHVRRCRRLAAQSDAGAHQCHLRHVGHDCVLPYRADGRRR